MKHSIKRFVAVAGLIVINSCGGADVPGGGAPVSGPSSAMLFYSASGNDQLGKTESALAAPLVVQAYMPGGGPVSGVRVTWATTTGSVTAQTTTTGADGKAAASWTLGATEGNQTATVTADNGASVAFQSRAIAFARPIVFGGMEHAQHKLWMMSADLSDMVQVTTVPARAPAWSPDGKVLAFMIGGPTSCSEPFGDLVVIDFVTMRETQLTQHDPCSRVGGPAWSPDGAQIAFVDHATKEIVFLKPDGSGKRVISIANGVDLARPSLAVSGPLLWYPDGSGLLFGGKGNTAPEPGRIGASSVWAINVDGSGLRQLALDANAPAAFSADGSELAFAQAMLGSPLAKIMVSDSSDFNAAQEVSGSAGISRFARSPNGTQWLADVYGLTGNPPCPQMPKLVRYDYDVTTRRVTVRDTLWICGAYAAWRP